MSELTPLQQRFLDEMDSHGGDPYRVSDPMSEEIVIDFITRLLDLQPVPVRYEEAPNGE